LYVNFKADPFVFSQGEEGHGFHISKKYTVDKAFNFRYTYTPYKYLRLSGSRFKVQGSGLKGYNRLKPLLILLGIQNISHNPIGGTGF
jgi:hypothetical protein